MSNSAGKRETVTARRLAGLLGISERRIGDLVHEGMPTVEPGPGQRARRFTPSDCVQWYIAYRTKPSNARDELIAEQVKAQRIRNQAALGELVDRDVVYRLIAALVHLVARALQALPAELSHEFTIEQQRALREACRAIRADLSRQIERIDLTGEPGADHGAADEQDDSAVGDSREAARA